MKIFYITKIFLNTDDTKSEYDISYLDYIDVDSMAKFYLVNEIMCNGELCHPKSCYFVYLTDIDLLKAGPIWDFDWAARSTGSALFNKKNLYFDPLFKTVVFNERLNSLIMNISEYDISRQILDVSEKIKEGVFFDGIRWGTTNRNPVGSAKQNWNEYVEYLEECIISRLQNLKEMEFKTEYELQS